MKPLHPTLAFLTAALCCLRANAADHGSRVTDAYRGVMQDRTANSDAKALFVEKCSMCHRQMGMGTVLLARRLGPEQAAMLEQRRDLSRALIEFAVRNGIGNMPRISRGEVGDSELDTIIGWLTRHNEERK